MKVLFIAPRYHLNLYHRIKALKKAGHEVFLLTLYKQKSERYDILEPRELKKSFFNKFLKKDGNFWKIQMQMPSFFDLNKSLKENNPDIVIIKNLQTVLSIMSLVVARINKKKIFVLIQTDNYFVKNKFKKIVVVILKKVFGVRRIITPLKNRNKKSDNFFIYAPFVFDVKDFDKKYFNNNKINIIDVGKFYKRKDHLLLLKVINKLKSEYDVRLTIIGESGDKEIEIDILKYIKDNKMEDIVRVMKNVSHSDVLRLYKEQDLFVLSSYNEPAAYSVIEAMASKLPVIVSDTSGTRCYIEEGENGYVFKSKNVNDLYNKIKMIIGNRNILLKMGQKSFEIVKKKHSLINFSEKFNKLV